MEATCMTPADINSIQCSAPCCLYNNCQQYAQYHYITPLYTSPENFTVIHSQRSYDHSNLEHYILLNPEVHPHPQTIPGYLQHLIPSYQASTTTVYDFTTSSQFQQPIILNPGDYYHGQDIKITTIHPQSKEEENPQQMICICRAVVMPPATTRTPTTAHSVGPSSHQPVICSSVSRFLAGTVTAVHCSRHSIIGSTT
ncbi:hypothetical protein LSTR_LSTR000359 [Laodelphax striatellus]|uniref:Uncharacterized protein n=1 Tax=Laodelphax striatellus TaxID=195883 RepID=A0A482X502_LAOST|nr:hypothetical protein LSTR_LSTR000359 [Laodelphax striatellus]